MSDQLKQYYKDFGVTPVDKKVIQDQELHNLYTPVKRDKGVNMPTFQKYEDNKMQQADLMFMPHDNGFKYILVVVDVGSKKKDGEALKTKSAEEVLKAFKTIYARGNIKLPKDGEMQVDSGSEFKGVVAKYFKDNNIFMRIGKTGRSRMQAVVESANGNIAKPLFMRMTAQELLTSEKSTEWVDDLPTIIDSLNKKAKPAPKRKKTGAPLCEGDACDMLEIGTKVRVMLEHPIDITDSSRLHGKFRKTDIRWDLKERTIKQVLLKPDQPPLYLLDGNVGKIKVEPVAYTKAQLQVIPKAEVAPIGELVIRGKPTKYIASEILSDKVINKKKYLLVKWKGFVAPEYALYDDVKADVPDMVAKYEAGKNKVDVEPTKSISNVLKTLLPEKEPTKSKTRTISKPARFK